MKPSNKTWSLTVRAGSLHLDAPHGSFEVRDIAPAVLPVVRALPDGTDVECEGSFDGGGTISNLVVTRIRRILKDMSGRVMELPDAIVGADGRLAAARARIHFAAGHIAQAAADVAALLKLEDDQAIAEYERLPSDHQQALLELLVEWQAQRPAAWRALRYVPIARWTDANLGQAVDQALVSGGVFGAAPGVSAETLLEELERRKRPTKTLAKQTQRLRRAQATEGDTFHRITTDLMTPRVIGADHAGVFVAGTLSFGQTVEQRGAHRMHRDDRRSVIVQYALDGAELRRWIGVEADRVVEGIALRIEHADPGGVRLSDGKTLYTFAHRIEHHDGELLWGIHARDPGTQTMRSQIVHVATGWVIASFDFWIDDVEWNAQHIFVRGPRPLTLTRDGKPVRDGVHPLPTELTIETASGPSTLPAAHAPWRFGSWQSVDAGGWIVHGQGRRLFLAPSEPAATWVQLELAKDPAHVDLAPPWLAIHSADSGPILLLALAEAMSAQEIRIDGKRFARRARDAPRLDVPASFTEWYQHIVDAGVTPPRSDVERDAHLHRTFEAAKQLPADALARVLIGHSPCCIDHADLYVDAEDALFQRLTGVLEGIALHEIAREPIPIDPAAELQDDDSDEKLTIEAVRANRSLRRQCNSNILNVMVAVDALLGQLGSSRRIYALEHHDWNRRAYLVITPDQRRALVAAGIEGIRSGPRG